MSREDVPTWAVWALLLTGGWGCAGLAAFGAYRLARLILGLAP